jgi:hypothetical protein
MTDESTEIVEWLGLRFRVPVGWEIVKHSLSLDNGSLVFVDRRHETLRVYWRSCERAPDMVRMLSDQRSRDASEHPGAKIKDVHGIAGWQGTIREQASGERVVHAAQFDSTTLRLLEVIVTEFGDESEGKAQRARLFNGFEVTAKAAEARAFRAFGLNVTVPIGFRLVKASAKPADVAFEFAEMSGKHSRPTGKSATVHRMGMAAAWAPADKQPLLVREAPHAALRDFEELSVGNHAAWSAAGQETRPRLLKLLGLGRKSEVLLWHCAPGNAIYSVVTTFLKRQPLKVAEFSTKCCSDGLHG